MTKLTVWHPIANDTSSIVKTVAPAVLPGSTSPVSTTVTVVPL